MVYHSLVVTFLGLLGVSGEDDRDDMFGRGHGYMYDLDIGGMYLV